MAAEVYVNKPGTVWSISLNLTKLVGSEPEDMPVIMGVTPGTSNELAPGIYESSEAIHLSETSKSTILYVPIELFTIESSDPSDFITFLTSMQSKIIVNPCTHLVVEPPEYFICQALPSNAFVGPGTSTKAESSNVSGNKVVLGANATGEIYSVAVGPESISGYDSTSLGFCSNAEDEGVAIGTQTRAYYRGSIAIGGTASDLEITDNCGVLTYGQTLANGDAAIAIGRRTHANGEGAIAIGNYIKNYNEDSIVLGSRPGGQKLSTCLTTRLFIMPAGSPLANKYEGGAACMGYTVQQGDIYSSTDGASLIIECGTRKMSEIFTNNTAFAPADLDPDAEHTPFNPDAEASPLPIPEKEQNNNRALPSNPLLEQLASKMQEKIQSAGTPELPALVKRLLATTKE